MDFVLQPLQLYFVILAGWINGQQQEVIEYLRTENHVLKEKLGKKRVLRNDDQRPAGPTGPAPYVAVPYLDRMDLAYAAADVALCRARAMTCAPRVETWASPIASWSRAALAG